VTGTDTNGCQNTDTITITVNPLPNVVANATNIAICLGDSVTLSGSGANSYSWDNGVTDGVAFAPTTTTIYTVTGTDVNGCQNTDAITITVNPLPNVVANATATSINAGEPVTLTGSGAVSYVWDNGVTDGDTVFPLVTTTYTIVGTDANGCQNTDMITITVAPTSDLRLEKIVDNASPNVGDIVTFTLTIFNDGPTADAGGTIVNDIIPSGYTYVGDDGNATNGTYNNGTGDWVLPSVSNGGSVSLQITATVDAPTGTAGEYNNIAQVTFSNNFDPDSTPNNDDGDQSEDDESSISIIPQVTDLEVVNTISASDANPGDVLVLTVEVLNNGTHDATNVTIDNIVPIGFTVTSINNGGVQAGNTISWSGMNIPNGTSSIVTFEVSVNIPTSTADEYLNTVQVMQVDQFDPDSTPNNDDGDQSEDDEDNAMIILIPADIILTKALSASSNANPNAGDTVTFEVTVTNDGPGLATNVGIEDIIPSGFLLGNVNNGGTVSGNTIRWTIPSLPVGSQVLTYDVTINAPANVLDEYRNIAQVTASDQFDPDSTPNNDDGDQSEDDEASYTIPSPTVDIEIIKTVDKAETFFGDTVVFTITATNNSIYDATNVGIEDALPSGYSFETASADLGVYDDAIATWEIPLISSGATATLEITVTVTDINDYTNVAELIFVDQIDPNMSNDRDEATPVVTQSQCLTVFNEFSPNDDGLNDVFFIECIDQFPNNFLQVFNRWGNIVFEMRGYDNSWGGISTGRATLNADEKLPVGTYYYLLELGDGATPTKTGWLYISR
ncbi:MAG: gliding motility-associated C-terminal domain-containing protein, partial [Bacteroidota bacterium]